jgi:hypothetical protein
MNKTITMAMAPAALGLAAGSAHAQIGWTLDQCRKHWGRENRIEHWSVDESQTTTEPAYIFGFGSNLEKEVTLDSQGKVKDIFYVGPSKGAGFLKIAKLLKGVVWRADPEDPEDPGHSFDPLDRQTPGEQGYRHAYWIGYKDGVAVFRARYYFGKRDVNALTWGESIEVTPIESGFYPPSVSEEDTDWARANAAPIEAEKKAKDAAGPTEEEKRQAEHDAEIRANNERALKGQ